MTLSIGRHGMWLAIPCLLAAGFLLARSISGVVRTVREALLFGVPLVEAQEVEFTEAGRVVLALEGPLLSRRHARLHYELVGPYALPVEGRRLLFRTVTSGWTTSSVQLMTFDVARPGRHVLRIHNLEGERPDDAKHRVLFLRPHLAKTAAYVVAILLSAALVIASLLLFFWSLLGLHAEGAAP